MSAAEFVPDGGGIAELREAAASCHGCELWEPATQVVFSVQYVLSIKPDVRSNIDYLFAFNEKIGKNRQKLYENFFGVFANYASFDKTMRTCTQNYECLVLDNTQSSSDGPSADPRALTVAATDTACTVSGTG